MLTFRYPRGVVLIHTHVGKGARVVCIGARGVEVSKMLIERTGHLVTTHLALPIDWAGDTTICNINMRATLGKMIDLDTAARTLRGHDVKPNYEPELMSAAMDVEVLCEAAKSVLFRLYHTGKVVVLKCTSESSLRSSWAKINKSLPLIDHQSLRAVRTQSWPASRP